MKYLQKTISSFLILILVVLSFGCSGAAIKIPFTTEKPIDTDRGRMVSTKKCGFQLLLFIPIMVNSRHQRAYESLLTQAGGDVLSNLRVEESWIYGFVGTTYCSEMQAVAYPKVAKASE